jgi:hypothetical protein
VQFLLEMPPAGGGRCGQGRAQVGSGARDSVGCWVVSPQSMQSRARAKPGRAGGNDAGHSVSFRRSDPKVVLAFHGNLSCDVGAAEGLLGPQVALSPSPLERLAWASTASRFNGSIDTVCPLAISSSQVRRRQHWPQ